jgi:lysophospholipase L1-like esterase
VSKFRLGALALALALAAAPASAKEPRREPKRLVSLGDSITEAVHAEVILPWKVPTPNEWASWVIGKHRRRESRLGLTNVNSHHQRLVELYGKKKQKNKSAAFAGADSGDLPKQAARAVKKKADYVTILIGHNDVCDDDFAGIPSDAEFETNVRAAFETLRAGLRPGATVYTVGMIDVYRLWEIGDELTALGVLDCQEIWENELFDFTPCGTMFGPDLTEEDRQFTRGRMLAFNQILADLSAEYDAADELHWWQYSNAAFELAFEPDDVSPIDCFHPSAEGQRKLSEATWADGPFAQ